MARLPRRTLKPAPGMPSMGTHRKPIVGRGIHGKVFHNIEKYHQSKAFKLAQPILGRGIHGHAFRNVKKWHQSKAFKMQQRSAARMKGASSMGGTRKRRQRPR